MGKMLDEGVTEDIDLDQDDDDVAQLPPRAANGKKNSKSQAAKNTNSDPPSAGSSPVAGRQRVKVPILVDAYNRKDALVRRVESESPEERYWGGSFSGTPEKVKAERKWEESIENGNGKIEHTETGEEEDLSGDEEFRDARSTPNPPTPMPELADPVEEPKKEVEHLKNGEQSPKEEVAEVESSPEQPKEKATEVEVPHTTVENEALKSPGGSTVGDLPHINAGKANGPGNNQPNKDATGQGTGTTGHKKGIDSKASGISEWSHQNLAPKQEEPEKEDEEDEWQTMPAYAPYDIYDDDNRLVAREHESDTEPDAYAELGGAGRGYTRVQLDEDAQSATSLDENTQYLFKDVSGTGAGVEDEEQRDAVSQMQATKDLLTEGQRIAYVGMTRLILSLMVDEAEKLATIKISKKETQMAAEAMKMFSQKMMVRLYAHMEISPAEQIMIEQLADHGVVPADLTPTLMQNARVKNPMAEKSSPGSASPEKSPRISNASRPSVSSPRFPSKESEAEEDEEEVAEVPPPYQEHEGEDLPAVRTPSQLPTTANLDIDLRWTVLCDLFLTLIADSVYDARARVLLERVGNNMEVSWLEICKFEKRVTDALEMQQAAEKENWNEEEHKETRRKMALKKRYVMMGLATVGGSLVIGLSAGLLAPMIGAGLAAGFTTIGVAGTGGFLAGAGGAAIITSSAAATGGIIAVRAANRRTGAVKTFEYRPLHNNKRVNLIVTVSGWMTGKVDDVRLPYSTVDPIMGDIYSVLWEPEMLTSMGDTINILATEALTQGLQQVLGSTILISLMAALQLPVVLTKLSYLIDNPWTVSLDRANLAGLILADSLIDRNLGTRPITFVGYSLGSRVIFSCLRELSRKGAYGLVQNVYLFGSPVVAKREEYLKARSVVSGRFVNGYARNDWILAYLFRLTSGGISRVAGIAPVLDVPGLENIDVTDIVPGHMSYRTKMPRLLREVGWIVESDEFTEIEDPDPENHQQRQRELINEIEEARKEFEKKEKESKGKFGFFSRKKKAVVERKEWETYEEMKGDSSERANKTEDGQGNNHGILFDVDAIRAELARERLDVRELESTLPPIKLDRAQSVEPAQLARAGPAMDEEFEVKELKSTLPPMKLDLNPPANSLGSRPSMRGSKSLGAEFKPATRQLSSEWVRNNKPPPAYAEEDEPDVEMTFDTSYRSPPRSRHVSISHIPEDKLPGEKAAVPAPAGNKSLPALPNEMDLGHNAWADEDEDFGKEKEIELTFA